MTVNEFRSELRRRLAQNARRTLLRIVLSESSVLELTGDQIMRQAPQVAEKFTRSQSGDVVFILLPHSLELFLLHLGLVLTKRIPAILPWPTARIDPEKYQRNLAHQLRNLPAAEIVTLPRLARNLSSALPYSVSACPIDSSSGWEESIRNPPLEGLPPGEVDIAEGSVPADALFLQFSGGTTGAQKAVVVKAPMLASQLESLGSRLAFGAEDSVVSWLPLYHVRAWINCSEPVRLLSGKAFAEQYAHYGVVPESLQTSYAMAENVFAVTQTELGKTPASFSRASVHRGASYPQLAFDLVEDVFVSSGRVLSGMCVRIVNSECAYCEDGVAGEIQIRTECMFSGYWGKGGFSAT